MSGQYSAEKCQEKSQEKAPPKGRKLADEKTVCSRIEDTLKRNYRSLLNDTHVLYNIAQSPGSTKIFMPVLAESLGTN